MFLIGVLIIFSNLPNLGMCLGLWALELGDGKMDLCLGCELAVRQSLYRFQLLFLFHSSKFHGITYMLFL